MHTSVDRLKWAMLMTKNCLDCVKQSLDINYIKQVITKDVDLI